MNLDFMPSPSPEHPGLFIRDPYRFSDAMLVIPPPLVECLECFDGLQTELDLRAALVSMTGELEVGQLGQHLVETLSAAGFLEDAQYAEMQQARKREFAQAAVREPTHAGSAYPLDPAEMRQAMGQWMDGSQPQANGGLPAGDLVAGDLFAIAAPHVSPQGGWQSYRAAYGMLRPEHKDRTFVILATSHYGEPETFGLTRKTFRTPLGDAPSDTALVDWLAGRGGKGVAMEDDDRVKAFFEALGELREREGDRLFWVMGVDMAHMGARYHDRFAAVAGEGKMQEVDARDQARIERINALDAGGFWDLVKQDQDDLKWCGSAPFYTFLKTAGKARGELLKYEQWNIDENSVVSFAGMGFRKG